MNTFLSYLAVLLLFGMGIEILWTQELLIGIGNMRGGSKNIGNWAYLVGGIFIVYGLYILYYLVFKQKKKNSN